MSESVTVDTKPISDESQCKPVKDYFSPSAKNLNT